MKDKSERREERRLKARYGPRLTNPGLRIVQRELAAKAQAELADAKVVA